MTARQILATTAALLAAALLATPAAAYQLTPEEQKLDCKKLTGRMQIRILQIRDRAGAPETSGSSRALQSVVAPVLGGTAYGTDPAATRARDVEVLKAYNARLKEKNCRTFDLEAELKPKPVTETPRPIGEKAGGAKK